MPRFIEEVRDHRFAHEDIQEIGSRDDPDDLFLFHNRQDPESVFDDQILHFFEGGTGPNSIELYVHVLFNLDMAQVKKEFGDRLTLFGGISVQTELPSKSPEDLKAIVRERVDTLGLSGGFMFTSSNTLLADAPPENILAAYREAARTS